MRPLQMIVFIKQVPDTSEVRLDPKTGTLIRDGVPSIINPDDLHALEGALAVKDRRPGSCITVITMGPPQAETALRQALAMGCDRAVLVCDRAAAGSDTWATSQVLAAAARKTGHCDILFAGRQAIDGDTAQVGPQVAEKLGLPQATYVSSVQAGENSVVVRREFEDGCHLLELPMPCMLTAIEALGRPRYPSFPGVYRAYEQEIPVWGIAQLGLDAEETGLEGSPTKVYKTFTPVLERAGVCLKPEDGQGMGDLIKKLLESRAV